MIEIKNKYARFLILVICVFALMGIAFKAIDVSFPTGEEKVDKFIDARVDKILWRYEDLIIEDGFFHDKNGVKYKVVKDEN